MALDHGTCANGPGWTNGTYATKQGFHTERAFSVNSFKPVTSNRNTLVKHKETPIEQQSLRTFGQPRIGLLSRSRPTIYMDKGVSKISKRTVKKYLTELETEGVAEVTRTIGRSKLYRIKGESLE